MKQFKILIYEKWTKTGVSYHSSGINSREDSTWYNEHEAIKRRDFLVAQGLKPQSWVGLHETTIHYCIYCPNITVNLGNDLCENHLSEYIAERRHKHERRILISRVKITIDDFDSYNGCPYCGDAKSEGSPCCGEVHDETQFMVNNGAHSMSESDFYDKYEVVDKLPRTCDCVKTCFCEPESTEER